MGEGSGRWWWALVFTALTGACLFRLAATGSVMSGDGVYYFAIVRSLAVDRDLRFENEFAHFRQSTSRWTGRAKLEMPTPVVAATGRMGNRFPVGTALLLLPAFALTHALVTALAAAGGPIAPDGYGWPYLAAAAVATAAYATAGLWLMVRVCQRFAAPRAAWIAVTAIWLATPLLYYTTVEPLYAHALSMAAVTAFTYATLAAPLSAPAWALAGGLGGLMSIIRLQDAAFLPFGLALIAWRHRHGPPRARVLCWSAFAAAAFLAVSPQLAANTVLNGGPLTSGYTEGFAFLTAPWLRLTLFSRHSGLLTWSPIVALAIAGLLMAARSHAAARIGLVAVLVQWYLVSSWSMPDQGHTYGSRMMIGCAVWFAVGLSVLLTRLSATRAALPARAAVACAAAANVILLGMVVLGK